VQHDLIALSQAGAYLCHAVVPLTDLNALGLRPSLLEREDGPLVAGSE
jgi:hypothetical protein